MPNIDYLYLHEKLGGAIDTLVTDPSDLHERLHRAVEHMRTLQFDGSDKCVPANMAPRLNEVRRTVQDGCDEAQAQKAAQELLDVYLDLHLLLEKA